MKLPHVSLAMALICELTAAPDAHKGPATSVPAFQKTSEVKAWPIGSLAVEGNQVYTVAAILDVAGLKVGQMAGSNQFDAARDRLLGTGAFETVGYNFGPGPDGKAFAAVFKVTEIKQVYPVRFESLPIESAKIRSSLHKEEPLFDQKAPATEVVVKRLVAEVQQITGGKLVGKLMPDASGELALVIHPESMPSVAQVAFTGNTEVPEATLRAAIAGVAIGSIYSEPRFRELLESSVRPVYEAVGRIKVAFPKLSTEPAKDVSGVAVSVQVEEGPVYKLGTVEIGGPLAGDRKLIEEGKFKGDEVANFNEIGEGVERIRKALRRRGYVQTAIAVDRKSDEHAKIVNLVLRPALGPMYQFGKLTIEGLDLVSEPQVRKLWALKPGAPFDAEYPDVFLSRLASDGVFENLGPTKSKVHLDETNHFADVVLLFSSDGKAPPAVGPARDEQIRREKQQRQP